MRWEKVNTFYKRMSEKIRCFSDKQMHSVPIRRDWAHKIEELLYRKVMCSKTPRVTSLVTENTERLQPSCLWLLWRGAHCHRAPGFSPAAGNPVESPPSSVWKLAPSHTTCQEGHFSNICPILWAFLVFVSLCVHGRLVEFWWFGV